MAVSVSHVVVCFTLRSRIYSRPIDCVQQPPSVVSSPKCWWLPHINLLEFWMLILHDSLKTQKPRQGLVTNRWVGTIILYPFILLNWLSNVSWAHQSARLLTHPVPTVGRAPMLAQPPGIPTKSRLWDCCS
jgi:hypothetical protein